MPTVSIKMGKGNTPHNDRSIKNQKYTQKSWDVEKTPNNIVYVNDDIKKVYKEVFGPALDKYNEKIRQSSHPERQIKDYYKHILKQSQKPSTKRNQVKPFNEIVVCIGDIFDKANPVEYPKIKAALDEYNKTFQARNPNLRVIQQITHTDEKGMDHTHIDFIPIGKGTKNGLETKVSMSGALKEMGYTGRDAFSHWREAEQKAMIQIMEKHDLEFKEGYGRSESLTVGQYKEAMRMADDEVKRIFNTMKLPELPKAEIKTNPLTKAETVKLSAEQYKDIQEVIKYQQTQITSLETHTERLSDEIKSRELKLEKIKERPTNALNEALTKENKSLKSENQKLKQTNEMINEVFEENEGLKKQVNNLKQSNESISKNLETTSRRESIWLKSLVSVLARLQQNVRYKFIEGMPILMRQTLEAKVNQKVKSLEQTRNIKMR